MEVILLERVAKLGQMGEVVRVKDGYARNFLLPNGKALRATKDNRAKFETMKTQLETRNLELKSDAEKVGAKLDGQSEVPATDSKGTGEVHAMLDPSTKVLIYRVTFSGLTGPAVAAHFHGPAAAGSNAVDLHVQLVILQHAGQDELFAARLALAHEDGEELALGRLDAAFFPAQPDL